MKNHVSILLVACLLICPTVGVHGQQGSRPALAQPNERGKNEVKVSAVFFIRGRDKVSGGTGQMSVRVFPNYSKSASVGVLEEFFGGTGDMWRTATWIAAFNAARLNDTTITDHEFLVKARGRIDGPSAGMLTTVAMLAVLRGDPVRPDVTMTGTINPDGTAGPVGGIPHKLAGAKAAGFKYFGYPIGCRTDLDQNTGEMIDLHSRARNIGMEVRQIRDIYEAYEFVTGKRLERPEQVSESDMELPVDLRTKVEAWSLRARTNLERRFTTISAKAEANEYAKQMLGMLIGKLNKAYGEAKTFESGSQAVAAYYRYMQGDALARALEAMIDVIPAFESGEMNSLVKHLQQKASSTFKNFRVYQLQARASLSATRLGGRIDSLNNMRRYAEAWAQRGLALNSMNTFEMLVKNQAKAMNDANEEMYLAEMTKHFLYACLFFEAANSSVAFADDWLNIDSRLGEEVTVTPERLELLSRAYASAGSSCLSYFDAVVTKTSAEKLGLSMASMQERLKFTDVNYAFAQRLASNSVISEAFEFENPMEASLFKLASGSEAYLAGAGMVNKYYSLKAKQADDGTLKINKRNVVGVMFDRARRRALEVAGEMKRKHGFIPDSVKMDFQLARALREGSDEDKLEGLNAYWHAASLCDLAHAISKPE